MWTVWMMGLALATEVAREDWTQRPAQPVWPVTLGLEAGALVGPGAAGAVGTVRVLVNLRPLSVELALGEGYLGGVQRQAGRIAVGLRRGIWRGSYVRVAFAHAHEVPWDVFRSAPGGSIAGTHHGIHHRSGIELASGWLVPLARVRQVPRLALSVDAAAQIYPGALTPRVTGQVSVGMVAHVGKARRARAP